VATDTIFALSSGRPPAAISIIRISGPRAHEAGERMAGALPEARSAGVRELRHPASGELLDEAIVLRFDCPSSSTGENIVEFQCHGGRAVVDAILDALASFEGFRPAHPGEFTRRAFDNGRIDLTEAEGLADLIAAETESQRKSALALAEGGLRKQILEWQQIVLGLSAEAERAIDYDEEDERVDPALIRGCGALAAELREWLERPRAERLKDGVRVVVAGPPNAGKSSLLNAIAGYERAIVTDVPGTTRDHIEVPLSIGGVPVLLTDTAGLREADDSVEAMGVARAEDMIRAADILIWLGKSEEMPSHARPIQLNAKCDLPGRDIAGPETLSVSSMTGQGVADVMRRVEALARELLPDEGMIPINRRQARHIEDAALALGRAVDGRDLALVAEDLRLARSAFDRLTGRAGVEEVLDALFGRFCLGK